MELGTWLFRKLCLRCSCIKNTAFSIKERVGYSRKTVLIHYRTSSSCSPCSHVGFISTAYNVCSLSLEGENQDHVMQLLSLDAGVSWLGVWIGVAHVRRRALCATVALLALLRERLETGITWCLFKWGIWCLLVQSSGFGVIRQCSSKRVEEIMLGTCCFFLPLLQRVAQQCFWDVWPRTDQMLYF